MSAAPELIRRHRAVEKVVRKYRGTLLDFRSADCIRMARTHLVALGHRPPPLPRYSNLVGARRALMKTGFATIEQLLDSLLPRKAPARQLYGDLVLLRGENDGEEDRMLDAITIAIGTDKVFGWPGDAPATILIPAEIKAVYGV